MIAIIFCFISNACSSQDEMNTDVTDPLSNQNVYAAGRENYVAKYWKNGNAVVLGKSGNASDAYSMVVVNNDVYVVGFEINNSGKYVANCWKNGIATNLTDGTIDAYANDIFIQGSDIYIAGQEIVSGGSTYVAKYWKNGVAVNLSDPTSNAVASGIAIYKNDVYVIGERNDSTVSNPVACYWKNGKVMDLSDQSTYAADQSIAVSGNDLVMMWSDSYNNSGQVKTQYSKNFEAPINVQDGTPSFRGTAVSISNNDIFIAGTGLSPNGNNLIAKYLKNGIPVSLSNGSDSSEALTLSTSGSDIYIGGYQSNSSAAGKAIYWKNDIAVPLTDGSSDALIRKIIVVNK